MGFLIAGIVVVAGASSIGADATSIESFRLGREYSLDGFGGIPFPADLDADGRTEILWLQSPGLFHSEVFDTPPYEGRFSEAERSHFCLTATDGDGAVLWQVGEPWAGERPFVTHSAERALDLADLDGDGDLDIVCCRRDEVIIIDGGTGAVEKAVKTPSDNAQIARIGRTGAGPKGWTILVKNAERSYPPHEYANPAWFYDCELNLLKTADYLGAGHTPLVADVDRDGFDEFVIGFNLVDNDLNTVWAFQPVPQAAWDAGEMHVDDLVLGTLGDRLCVVAAASDTAYVLDARDGELLWKQKTTHPQHCQIGHFHPDIPGTQIFIHNKRAELQLFDPQGAEIWTMMPPENFPLGAAAPCERQKFHVFDPTTVLPGMGPNGTDLLIFTDGGWPYVINGRGERCLEFPHTPNAAQDWGAVPGRPDDYGYGFYARFGDFDGDGDQEVLLNDRRFAWLYEPEWAHASQDMPRSDARVMHVDFEGYVDGVVQVLNAGVRWLGDPFADRNEGTVEVTHGFAFSGERCGHIETQAPGQVARIRLQPRFDTPSTTGDSVVEFMFRAIRETPVDLSDLTVWSAAGPAGLTLFANGTAASGVYQLDVLHGGIDGNSGETRSDGAVTNLPQAEWVRIVLYRHADEGLVDLWAGPPGHEVLAGTFPDLNPRKAVGAVEIGDTSEDRAEGSGFWDDVRAGGLLEAGQETAPPEPPLRDVGQEVPPMALPIVVGTEKQLFVDDALIASSENVERVLHPVQKHPDNPLVAADRPWEGECVLLYGAVIRDPESGLFRMWYLAWGKHVGQSSYICYAESEDGLRWAKPNLGLHEFRNSKDNNIVIPDVTSNTTVIYDPRDTDASRRYKAVIRGRGTRAWLSPDGVHWRDHGVIIDQCYDSTTVHWDPVGEQWIASVKIFRDGKRARGYAESKDFFHWSDTYFMATVDERDAPDDQIYAMIVFRYESVYLGLLRMYHVDTDIVDIQLASSRNARHWDRLVRDPFIPCSPVKGTWDYGNNSPSTDPPLRVGDELRFYYCGRSTVHDEVPNRGAIGLGTLRVDGFVSMRGGTEGGVLTTQPLRLDGDALFINANAEGGRIRVEILDEAGAVVAPFSAENTLEVPEDNIRVPVRWEGGAGLKTLAGRAIRLRFHLENADLYAFWTE